MKCTCNNAFILYLKKRYHTGFIKPCTVNDFKLRLPYVVIEKFLHSIRNDQRRKYHFVANLDSTSQFMLRFPDRSSLHGHLLMASLGAQDCDFDSYCLLVHLEDLEALLQTDFIHTPLSSLCQRDGEGKIVDLLFPLPEDLRECLSLIYEAARSEVYSCIWRKKIANSSEGIDLGKTVDCLHKPVLQKVNKIFLSLIDGSISLDKVKRYFDLFKSDMNFERIKNELSLIHLIVADKNDENFKIGKNAIEEGARKVFNFFKLQINRRKASSINLLWKRLDLRGDFRIFEEIEAEVFPCSFVSLSLSKYLLKM